LKRVNRKKTIQSVSTDFSFEPRTFVLGNPQILHNISYEKENNMIPMKISTNLESQSPLHSKLLLQILQKTQIKPQINGNSKESGFTLIELLVGMAITTIVVLGAGAALLFILTTNAKSDVQITQQSNIRRAADFISDEIKAASVVTTTDPEWIGGKGMTPVTSSTTIGINPVGLIINPVGTSPTQAQLFLEIPMPVVDNVVSNVITITNHGLIKGNAVRLSGNNLPSLSPALDNTTTYYVNRLTDNTFSLVKSDNSALTISTTPQNFAVRRLVAYYTTSLRLIDEDKWKGPRALYRATGNCNASSSTTYTSDANNCLVMLDSLTASPFTVNTSTSPNTLTINGQLCTPATMLNTCPSPSPTPALTSVTVQAVSRATLK
jgi:prepilin-type N-terminal cleavage/methylation domain-containing protein